MADSSPLLPGLTDNPANMFVNVDVLHMSDLAAKTYQHRADADVKVADANARAAASTHEAPAVNERKRDVRKTGLIVLGVLAIVVATVIFVPDKDRADVLKWCAIALAAAWGVTETAKALTKHLGKPLPPISDG